MTTQREFQDIVSRLHAGTGDPNAWMTGLSPAEVQSALFYSIGTDEPALNPILAKIRANHPGWFDGTAAAPTPPGPQAGGQPQAGAAATAVKKAESDLAQQNSATATLDLMVISAVLNAHATSTEGAETLRALQREIDDAVRTRTDLDTPAGARDFQRFLVGKLRHIGRVVEEAGLDDRSKAALATAWTALYESTKRVDDAPPAPPPDEQAPAPTKPAAAAAPSPELPPYGTELPMDLMADPFAGLLPPSAQPAVPAAASAPPSPPAVPAPALPSLLPPAPGGGLPGAAPAGLPLPRGEDAVGALRPPGRQEPSLEALEELLAAEEAALAAEESDAEPDRDELVEDEQAESAVDEPESSVVELPDGELVSAPTPALARVLRAALAGTAIVDAFHQQGIAIAPPGTPVPDPVDPARIGTGDVAMFTDRQGLALDRHRALLDGQIRPVDAVSGPSFLGWLHPPAADDAAPPATTPNSSTAPAPTRPAATAQPAR